MLKKILPIFSTFSLAAGLITTACGQKPAEYKQEYKPIYNYYVLSQSFEQEVEAKFHNELLEKQNEIIYIDETSEQSQNYGFFTQANLEEIKKRKENESVNSNYDLLSQREKDTLINDLNKVTKASQLEKSILNSMSSELLFYSSILDLKNDEFWFNGISYDFSNIDFGYLSFDNENKNYIANVNLDLVFSYQYTDINSNVINKKYQEDIVITISNQNDIINNLKFATSQLRDNLVKDKFKWAWFDAYDLRISDYAKLFNLKNSDFEELFKFDKFEQNFLNYISEHNSNTTKKSQSYNFAFKKENRFKNFRFIDQINNFNVRDNKYGAKTLLIDDSFSTTNKTNINLFKTIFSQLLSDDQIVLENKLVKGNKDIYTYLSNEYLDWVNSFQTKIKDKFAINSNSIVSYGEITLNNFSLYFDDFNYYHPISPISYYVAISANNLNDTYLTQNNVVQTKTLFASQDPIFKALYQNTINALEGFYQAYAITKTSWTSFSDNQPLVSFTNSNIWEIKNALNGRSISDVNAALSLLNQSLTSSTESERQTFLNKTNTSSFHFQFNNYSVLENIPIIDISNNQLIFKKFKEGISNLSIDFDLSFLNLSFVIKSDKFYWFERTLIESI
ncbi:hypothetical protein ESOMN_v1c04850 [Williamsoniiplasma somnilux]|uniref:Lipoprotein n=2 Tax=Williamsoniiplasma somnilux TaxID=215578 RepID=A0A2K8NYJ9_9MOLU|nr:hypothetical protein [Williamsoniiplasma somnilux]ATZ18867.1 hypothetical protein ESOMN_v1c04850 [Williamsoniiplasma somnilux]